MTHEWALKILTGHNAHRRLVQLCADEWPGVSTETRDAWRRQVVVMAERQLQPEMGRLEAAYAAHGHEPKRGGCCPG